MSLQEFQSQFIRLESQLKAYLIRLVGNKSDADDLTQDTYLKAATKIQTFKAESSLKTWIFSIATNLARDHFRASQRWVVDGQDLASGHAKEVPSLIDKLLEVNQQCSSSFEIKEHIDFCFTCMGKTLPIDQQVVLILKDVFEFKISEIMEIVGFSEGVVKHTLANARKTMVNIYAHRCALIRKEGACHQCSELNGIVNPQQDTQVELMKLKLVEEAARGVDNGRLYELRLDLVRAIDPLTTGANKLYEYLLSVMPDYALLDSDSAEKPK